VELKLALNFFVEKPHWQRPLSLNRRNMLNEPVRLRRAFGEIFASALGSIGRSFDSIRVNHYAACWRCEKSSLLSLRRHSPSGRGIARAMSCSTLSAVKTYTQHAIRMEFARLKSTFRTSSI
jgi:hypothetical protein